MASPQKENGYTPIANELLEAMAGIRIPGEARQCLDVIFRKTYGYNKKSDAIALSQFCLITKLGKNHVCRALLKLQEINIIITQKGNGIGNIYLINKDFGTWKPLPKKRTLPKKGMTIPKKGNNCYPKRDIQKTKDNITKDNIAETSSAEEFSFNNKLSLMANNVKDKRMPIIAEYWKYKQITFHNPAQYSSGLKRELRPAQSLVGYDLDKIKEVMFFLNGQDFKWTLESVHKYIIEPNLQKYEKLK